MTTVAELTTKVTPTWCPGCGDFTILATLKNAVAELGLDPKDTVIVSGIGCGSKTPHYVKTYGFEGLHGRGLPVAQAIKLANHKLHVIMIAGDGDVYGIGLNHLMHAMRRNVDVTCLVQNNMVYGLTKGQTSPTSAQGFKTGSTPTGVLELPVNPIALGLGSDAGFLARGYNLDINHLKSLFMQAITHKGFSLVDVFQVCAVWNKVNTPAWFKERLYRLEDDSHDSADREAAEKKGREWGDRIPIGLFYKEDRPTYEDGLFQIKDKALVDHDLGKVDVGPYLDTLR
ncbi:MAG: 2-oxoacid:ferredoxin oxidoreductase subunit beta [archaeon]